MQYRIHGFTQAAGPGFELRAYEVVRAVSAKRGNPGRHQEEQPAQKDQGTHEPVGALEGYLEHRDQRHGKQCYGNHQGQVAESEAEPRRRTSPQYSPGSGGQ